MKRVLCLFYYFPPSGGAGALRCSAIARELLLHGWQATVIAPEGGIYHMPGDDLLDDIPHEVAVVRTGNLDLRRPLGLLRRLGVPNTTLDRVGRAVLVPDAQWGWVPFARRAAGCLLAAGGFDALLTAGAPWTAHLLGRALARKHRIPWVAMFADEWSTAGWYRPATPFHRRLDRHLEGRVLASASAVTTTTPTMRDRLAAAHPDLSPRIEVVDNGYDERIFRGRSGRLPERFTLLYTGTIYRAISPAVLLDVVTALRGRARLRILGFAPAWFVSEIVRKGLGDLVSVEPPRPHAEAVQAMLEAHVLVAALDARPSSAAVHPSKLFEYLRAGRHLLTFFPDGEAARLVAGFEGCARLRPGDREGAVRVLEGWVGEWEAGRWPQAPLPRPGLEAFSRAAQAGRLARVLDEARP